MAILLITPGLKLRDGITAHSLNLIGGWLEAGIPVYAANPGSFVIKGEVLLNSREELSQYLAGTKPAEPFNLSEIKFESAVVQYAISTYWLRTWALNRWIINNRETPIVLCCHEPTREIALLRAIGRMIYLRAISASSKVVTFSEVGRQSLRDISKTPIQVLSLGVPEVDTSRGSGRKTPHLLLFGYYLPDKGFELGLAAVLDALRKVPGSLHLTVVASLRERVGSSRIFSRRDRRNFEEFLSSFRDAEREFPESFEIREYLTQDQLMTQLDRTDYLLLPYLKMTNSGVAVTAKAHGLPVIASSLTSLKEAFGHSAIYIDNHSIDGWSARLNELASEEDWKVGRLSSREMLVEMRGRESSREIAKTIISPLSEEG